MNEAVARARELLAEKTPLKTDCGKICGARCCRSLEGEETGMLLFPGEEEAYLGRADWKVRKAAGGLLAVCPGHCNRQERPLACRIFPALPVIRDGAVKVAADQRAAAVCPLLKQGLKGMDPAFTEAVREAGKVLAADPHQRAFLERMTEGQDELKALRKRLGGL